MDLKLVLKHICNGTLGENLCIICLSPLSDRYENIFTKVIKADIEFCVADVLDSLCQIKFSEEDNYNVCVECFKTAYMAYKFRLLSNRSNEIINFYSDELSRNLDYINLPEELSSNTLCISLPSVITLSPDIELNLQGIGKCQENIIPVRKTDKRITQAKAMEGDVVVNVQENGEWSFYKILPNGTLILLDDKEENNYKKTISQAKPVGLPKIDEVKTRRKRLPMTHKLCSKCPVKYRFAAKLKEHMKVAHDIDLFICKLCKAITEDEHEYHNHMRTHTNIHQCDICHTVFKKRDTIIKHLKWHERMKNMSQAEGAHICEICGVITEDEHSLREHYDNKHYKKYTCYYCGRLYKGENSFETHIKKHEARLKVERSDKKEPVVKQEKPSSAPEASAKQKCMCPTCGRYFVDERALLWHQRLHNNERPYICEVCDRGFVSLNRRNQHALCAHTAPTRRCPLCPALFHLKSMVNTHIKKVHLKKHKRRNRMSKHQNVFWRTEAVPIQELSVDIQNEILELQAHEESQSPSPALTMN
ncbi:zinc finger protein 711-like [Anticarsia gemmatalis]|uniref:zinc finger protein 711-like n=1 Tax=Anticarsia gemmatalis TaxID=129554 RepID=UPI003F763EA8